MVIGCAPARSSTGVSLNRAEWGSECTGRLTSSRERSAGQGIFRKALLTYWKYTCPITDITDHALLRASHIIPWARCESDAERMDVQTACCFHLFGTRRSIRALSVFDDEGRSIVSPDLSEAAMAALQPGNAAPLPLTPEHRTRLAWHRVHLER